MHVNLNCFVPNLLTDLPTILSGNKIAYLEPHEEIWKGESGQCYTISDCVHKTDTFAPFEGLCGFSSDVIPYNATLFRFPLRNVKKQKRVSLNTYDISKLYNILTALKKEAKFVLLFLRSVTKVIVYEISGNGSHTCLFEVDIQETSHNKLVEKRAKFQQQLLHLYERQAYSISRPIELVVHVQVHVTDHQQRENNSQTKFLVASKVGSQSKEVHDTAEALKVFPWVGVALELNRQEVSDSGRVFCVLPMPPDVQCHLPVHVNGTFSLNDERRALKWQGLETRNDHSAKWNYLIITHLLPLCYASMLLEHAKMLLKPNEFFQAWPNAINVCGTHWEGLLKPLLENLFTHPVLWSQHPQIETGLWIKVSSATFASCRTDLPDVIRLALWACKEKLVCANERVWSALEYVKIPTNTVTPQLIRSKLKQFPNSYVKFTPEQKIDLLKYCLLDGSQAYNDLSNLALLPLANDTFTFFQSSSFPDKLYLCSSECPLYLLPNLESDLVDIKRDPDLFKILKVVAKGGYTRLKFLESADIAYLLPKSIPQEWKGQQVVTLPHPRFPMEWIKKFWEWVPKQQLHLFSNQLIVPVHANESGTLAMVCLSDSSPAVFIPSTSNCSTSLQSALRKFHVRYCLQSDYQYLQHYNLSDLMNHFSADGILNALRCASHFNASLSEDEAAHLRKCLIGWQNITHLDILTKLPIFSTIPQFEEYLYSVATANSQNSVIGSAKIKPLLCPLSPENFPSNLILFSDSDHYQTQLLQSISITPISIINLVISLLQSFQRGQLKQFCLQSFMKEVLENYSEICSRETPHWINNLNSTIANISFIPTSRNTINKPESLFSPLDSKLKELYQGELVFPVDPFTSTKCVHALKQCGLKTTVSPQEIVDIITAISYSLSNQPILVEHTKYVRAKAVLDYIRTWNSQKLDEYVVCVFSKQRFLQALMELSQSLCWLPIQAKPPPDYPDCLVWKGSEMTSHFISVGPSVLLCHNQNTLANIYGSQVFFVDHSLPANVCKLFTPNIKDMLRHLLAHFEDIILNKNKIPNVKTITYQIYEQLHFFHQRGCNIQLLLMKKTQKCVWISKYKRFVHPDFVAIKQNPTFRQNLEPFIWMLPDDLEIYSPLFQALGVKHIANESQIIGILEKIKQGSSKSLCLSSEEAWQLVMSILNWITGNGEHMVDASHCDSVYVPTESHSDWPTLEVCKDVVYTDSEFLKQYLLVSKADDDSYTFVNHRITPQLAYKLRLEPLSEYLNLSEDAFEDVGQSEPLTVRLKNILKDYKDGLTIIKELLQNADDAGAKEMSICYDARQHTVRREALFFPGMADCHGPALLVHNDAKFTQEDFTNITKLAGATKEGKPLKIGKFGVGFCSVYHITDVPSFVSDNLLYIFDPTLSYLKDEIKNPAKPGKRITFTSDLIFKSQQLAPYKDVFGFDAQRSYEGTMFRFPFRHSASELSGKIYTINDIKQLIKEIQFSSSKLLLFLQSVTSLTVSQFDNGATDVRQILKVTNSKQPIEGTTVSLHQITCNHSSSQTTTDFWLVESYKDTILSHCSIASIACSLTPIGTPHGYKILELEGEMFCFLPLSMKTGLPVHISSNFAVSNNRRGIWTSDDESRLEDEVKWNEALLTQIIPTAYCRLLEALKELSIESKLYEYSFFSLWPLKNNLKLHNPWTLLVDVVYNKYITLYELFFSVSVGKWLSLEESKFLSSDILKVSSNDGSVFKCILNVEKILGMPVVLLPLKYQSHLDLDSSMITEKEFLHVFFLNISKFDSILDSRNKVLSLAFVCLANELDRKESRFFYLQNVLQNNACVPCVPDGLLLRKCIDVVDPKSKFSKLFDEDDQAFPLIEFCKNGLVMEAMKSLGMLQNSFPPKLLVERAKTIPTLFVQDQLTACVRVKNILDCFINQLRETSSEEYRELAKIPFLPVVTKPQEYPLIWFGDQKDLCSGNEAFIKGKYFEQTDHTNANIAGSQVPFVSQEPPEKGGCGLLTRQTREILSIGTSPPLMAVISHFKLLIGVFLSQKSTSKLIMWANRISLQVYAYLDNYLETTNPTSKKSDIFTFGQEPCIWMGETFIAATCVAVKWSQSGPYLFSLPQSIATRKNLQKYLQIKETFTAGDYTLALKELKGNYESNPLPDNCQKIVQEIISQLNTIEISDDQFPFMLPDTTYVMHEASDLCFDNTPWLPADGNHMYVHKIVPLDLAKKLGVQMMLNNRLSRYEVHGSMFKELPFGQREDLTRRIGNILRDYPFDITLLKELLQNADDAKATKMYVILDKREHSSEHVLSEEWKNLHGPALLVWNDSEFSETDLQGIQELGLGSKRSDTETIGQYGIGFNAVYHLTDCPSFVTGGDTLCILDPHCRYVPEASVKHPGRMFKDLDERFWKAFDDLESIYLRDGLSNRPEELLKGALFRFPLRHSFELANQSDIVKQLAIESRKAIMNYVISESHVHKLLSKWFPLMKNTLFFLNHVTELKYFVIDRSSKEIKLNICYRAEIDEKALACRVHLSDQIKDFTEENESEPHIEVYPLSIVDTSKSKEIREEWLVQKGVGDIENKAQKWSYISQMKPRHGIAAPFVQDKNPPCGQVFCFLPLPIRSGLPVHVNGHFILDSSRRSLWKSTNPEELDAKSQWNQCLIEAIASSYAHFLNHIREHYSAKDGFIKNVDVESIVRNYYSVFPRCLLEPSKSIAEPWCTLAKHVFKFLVQHNFSMLVVLIAANYESQSCDTVQRALTIEWHPLRNIDDPLSQVFFWRGSGEKPQRVRSILERIGMKITCAPLWIRNHFKEANLDIPLISPETIFQYYIKFYYQILGEKSLPCMITATLFKSVDDFKTFSDYLLASNESTSNSTSVYLQLPVTNKQNKSFPQDPFGHPLLLTADSKLRLFEKSNKALLSKYLHVFPTCQDRFLHKDLLELPYSSSYFLSITDGEEVRVKIINELLQTILPSILRGNIVHDASDHVKYQCLKVVWGCLVDETVFSSVLQEVIKTWALLLSTSNTLFRYSSSDNCLPIIPFEAAFEDCNVINTSMRVYSSTYDTKCASNVLKNFPNVPFLDTKVVPYEAVSKVCPQFSKPETILRNLYYVHQINDLTEFMTRDIVKILTQYFRLINFKVDSTSCSTLRHLPFFETIEENFTHLDGKKVFVWPRRLPRTGCKKWHTGNDLVFLETNGAWTDLHVQTELQIVAITEEDIYIKFVFPNFYKMTQSERFEHLEHIRENLFNINYKNRDHLKHNIIHVTAQNFILSLETLECLENSENILKPIKSFCDHEKDIFLTFLYYFNFIPEHFKVLQKTTPEQYKSWMIFFRKLGLRDTLTSEEYCTLCHDTADGKLGMKTKNASAELLSYLFHETQKNRLLSDRNLLKKIATIPFVCKLHLPKLEWMHQACPPKNIITLPDSHEVTMCSLAGSCLEKHKEILWTVKPVFSLLFSTTDNILRQFGIMTKPGDYVVENIANLSNTPFAQLNLFHKYTAPECKAGQTSLMEVMMANFNILNQRENAGCNLSNLKKISCIPVYTSNKLPVLVKPQHVIFTSRMDHFYPFLHSAPLELYSVKFLLKKIGIADSLQLEHVQVMLQLAFENVYSMELDPNTLKSVNCALKYLITLLKKSKEKCEVVVQKLEPLYLLATDNQLHHASKLVYCNNPAYQLYSLNLAETGLYLLQISDNILHIKEEEFCALLPKAVRPQPLSLLCSETLSPTCQECLATECAKNLQQSLQITNLPQAMSRVFRHITKNEQLSQKFEEQLPLFFNNIEVVCIDGLQIDITLKYENKEYLVASPHVECHIQEVDSTYRLYLNSNVSDIEYKQLLTSISERSISKVQGTVQLSKASVQVIVNFFEDLLSATNEEQVYSYLLKKQIGTAGLDVANHDLLNPKLGDTIPKSWHFRLKQDIQNIFFPQEWVGYEKSEEHVVFSQIVYCIKQEDETDGLFNHYNLKCKIILSEDDENGTEVSTFSLYKFIIFQRKPEFTKEKILKCVPLECEVSESDIVQNLDEIKEEIRRKLHEIFKLPQVERKTAIRRLYLKWHPDKNTSNPAIAEEAFKFLKHEFERLEHGSESSWQRYHHAWDDTAHSHKYYYQQYYYPRSSSGAGGRRSGDSGHRHGERQKGEKSFTGFFGKGVFTPPKQEAEGKRWIRQAEMDFIALDTLLKKAETNNNLSGNVCFMAHEVAEKALKGAMYATHGLRDASLKSHTLEPLARALESHTPKATGLTALTTTLEPYYFKTRFPNFWQSPKIPAEQFPPSEAEDAREKAMDILEIVNNIV